MDTRMSAHDFGKIFTEKVQIARNRPVTHSRFGCVRPQAEIDNNVHLKGIRFICGPHLAIIDPSEARADLMAR